jgi:DNA-binding transcriptional ArsR family regulator
MSNHSSASARADDVFDALGDPTRRQIIARLRPGPTPVGKLADQLTIGRPAVSKHLRVLEGAGLVRHESRGTRNLYALAPEGMAVAQQWLVGMWDTALAAYADAVDAAVEEQVTGQAKSLARSERSSRRKRNAAGGSA